MNTRLSNIICLLLLLFIVGCYNQTSDRIDLSGEWQFITDPNNQGIREQWFSKDLRETIQLPGSMKENDKGEVPSLETVWTGTIYDSSFFYNPHYERYRCDGDIKFPFWLTPNLYYKGVAWYRKEINIPKNQKNSRFVLHLERVHWQSEVWINDHYAGSSNSLSTPHIYDLTKFIGTGKNTISVRIDNQIDSINVGPDSHSISDHTQGNWNGIVGQLYLEATPTAYIADLQLYPDISKKTVKAVFKLQNTTGKPIDAELQLQSFLQSENKDVPLKKIQMPLHLTGSEQQVEVEYPMGKDIKLWDEFAPNLYRMKATLNLPKDESNSKEVIFGMRDFTVKGNHFEINGRPVFLRGTLENNAFPLTGYPPTDVESWMRIFLICKQNGLNHIRFHSHCPPEAAFTAADRIGIYLQPEAASWPNHGTSLGDGRSVDQYILAETKRIIKAYGNHPSFVMWAYCNEPYGNYVPFLDKSLKEWKAKDKRRVYTAASIAMSWKVNPESEYLVRSASRGLPFQSEPNSTFNYSERIADEPRPYVTHEMGQWCVFPDFSEIAKYTGVYKAKNFELFQEEMKDKHLEDQAHDFLMASGKLQALCYKAEIEAALRTPELDGFQLLGLTDFPGQGTALVGMYDVFWNEKPYFSSDEISQFCNQTVPLAELNKFVFSNDEVFSAHLKVSHFGPVPYKNINPEYKIFTEEGNTIQSGKISTLTIPTGRLNDLGEIKSDLSDVLKATKCTLELQVGSYKNQWEFWVYPKQLPIIQDDKIYYTQKLDQIALDKLEDGKKVFLDVAGSVENGKDIQAYFTPVFWNTSWFKMRPPHTLGILVQDKHLAFTDFPTEYHSDFQWWEILNKQQVMCIDSFPVGFKPLVQPIDTWFLNRRLAQLFEARVGKGKLMVSSLNLNAGPAAKQLRYSILKYMNSPLFNPENKLNLKVIQEILEKKERQQVNFYTVSTPDELKPEHQKNK